MQLTKFQQRMKDYRKRLSITMHERVTPEVAHIMLGMKNRSPKDTGAFASGWQLLHRSNIARGGGYKYIITNAGTSYGVYLDTGAEAGGPPWYWPKEGNVVSDGGQSRSGKLIYSQGRVWAGGRTNPEYHVVGGIIDPILFDTESERVQSNQNNIANAVAAAIIEAL